MSGATDSQQVRELIAWLLWCINQGYTNPDDRAILPNWMGDDPATLTKEDVRAREHLLAMADEVLTEVATAVRADERARIRQPLPHTLSVLRSQVHAAIEEWHDEPDQNYANGVSITDAVMRVVGPVLQLVHGSHAGLLADAPDGTVPPGDAT